MNDLSPAAALQDMLATARTMDSSDVALLSQPRDEAALRPARRLAEQQAAELQLLRRVTEAFNSAWLFIRREAVTPDEFHLAALSVYDALLAAAVGPERMAPEFYDRLMSGWRRIA